MPWLRRKGGGLLEVVEGVETRRGEPFEVSDDQAKALLKDDAGRFERAPAAAAKKAAAKADRTEPVATGPGGTPADEVAEAPAERDG